jgi:predicted nucleic acid-binding protein
LKDAGMTIFELKGEDILLAIDKTEANGLIIADAAHLVIMQKKGIVHLASADNYFLSVTDIIQWSPL